jgi:ribonuclease R
MQKARILSLLGKSPGGLDVRHILAALGAGRKDRTKLLGLLKSLEAEDLVRSLKGKFRTPPATGLVRGRFVTTRRGFGFVSRAGAGEDIFVPARFAEGVFQGDEVEVLVQERGKFGKPEGKVVRVLKKERTTLLGIFRERAGAPFLQAFESPSAEDLPLRSKGGLRPREGMIIEVDRRSLSVSSILGRPEDPGVDSRVIIRRFGLSSAFPDDALAETAAAAEPGADDFSDRSDMREWDTVTIDGEKARDFDDAVSIRRLDNGHVLLGVHIADVSHYIKPGTSLDREAYRRATSVYFPDLTLPMLPEKLSNDLCSLRPRVPRLTVSVLMEFDAAGALVGARFAPSVIRTVARMTYASVFKILENDPAERRRHRRLVPSLVLMRDLARLLRARRLEEGGLDFDLVEPELVYEEGKLIAVAAAERNEAHRLIEEFMVAANVAVASHLAAAGIATIYRVHPAPSAEDLAKLRDIVAHFGYLLPEPDKIRSKDLARLLEKAQGQSEEKFVGIQVLRAMKLAVYSPENVGHYGLAKADYTHFTSPIRRYPDLVVHRILKAALKGEEAGPPALEAAARHSSEMERTADEAEQALVEWRIFRLLKERLGDEFKGVVVDVAKAGLVVELDDYFVEGLLLYQALGGVSARRVSRPRRVGPRRRRYELGDRIRVILVACDPVLQRMSFIPGPEGEGGT